MKNNNNNKLVGFGLILGVAIGYSFGNITNSSPTIYAGIGAGLGIVFGAIITQSKKTKKS